ncbi:putative ABC transport system ATP-binding protein [Salana multivorans]|uniref:Putative ABC transport system ATP-binding protein n=1 Tax=Salana multivorans TaxID=120377 RepID=A0A3N2DAH5_9MICO|nr:ABC transporter ATP-binding protein [Salana multivorans]ROR96638.1 putative ABC transport system ATP-binding protein [Salana multivorans]
MNDAHVPPRPGALPTATSPTGTAATAPAAGVSPTGTPPAAVRALDLSKVYGTGEAAVRALDHADVAFGSGEFTAIMGASGSGKSTLLHLLAGLDSPTTGRVVLGDTDLTLLDDDALTLLRRARIGFVFQSFNLLPMFTAEQNILLPLELAGRRVDAATRAWFDQLVGILGLRDRLTHLPSELSGGQQQRVAIARALLTRPDVVFADEPTGNLDSRSGAEVLDLLRTSVRELGQTVVMVTHDSAAAAYADRVVLVADGRIAGDLRRPTPETVQAHLDALREAALTSPTTAQVR